MRGKGKGAARRARDVRAGARARNTISRLCGSNRKQHKISLSYRAAQKQAERQEIEIVPRQSKSSPTATIGDAIMAKRQAQ